MELCPQHTASILIVSALFVAHSNFIGNVLKVHDLFPLSFHRTISAAFGAENHASIASAQNQHLTAQIHFELRAHYTHNFIHQVTAEIFKVKENRIT